MNSKIIFKKPNELEYTPKRTIISYYQICQLKNPLNGKYFVRKLYYDTTGNMLKLFEKEYEKNLLNEFLMNIKDNKYQMYPTYDLKLIKYPDFADILKASSNLLNNDNTYSGYANF